MDKEQTIKKFNDLIKDVESWEANDGGFTMAACDLINLTLATIAAVENDDRDFFDYDDRWNASTGTETDLIDIYLEWSKN